MCGSGGLCLSSSWIQLLLCREGIESNPGPVHDGITFNYERLRDTKKASVLAPPPNGILFTGPAYEVNHSVNNNSVVQVTATSFQTRYNSTQLDFSYPLKGSFLYPLKLGARAAIIAQVARNRCLPDGDDDHANPNGGDPRMDLSDDDDSIEDLFGPRTNNLSGVPSPGQPGTGKTKRGRGAATSTPKDTTLPLAKRTRNQGRAIRKRIKKKKKTRAANIPCQSNSDNASYSAWVPPVQISVPTAVSPPHTPVVIHPPRIPSNSGVNCSTSFVPFPGSDDPHFTVPVKLNLAYITGSFSQQLAKCPIAQRPPLQVTLSVRFINSATKRTATSKIVWDFRKPAGLPKSTVQFPFCQDLTLTMSSSFIIEQEVLDECMCDCSSFAAPVHFCCEQSSSHYWTVNPASISLGTNSVFVDQPGFVEFSQGDLGYKSLTLVPTNCLCDPSAKANCNPAIIRNFLKSLGEEVTTNCHGQKNLFLFSDSSINLDSSKPTLTSIEADHCPLDSWSYYQTVTDYELSGDNVGCKQNIQLRKADKLTYIQFVGYDPDGQVFNFISTLDFTYRASYVCEETFELGDAEVSPSNLDVNPTCLLLESAVKSFPPGQFTLVWFGFWSKYGGLKPTGTKFNCTVKKPISLKSAWNSKVIIDPGDCNPTSSKDYVFLNSSDQGAPKKVVFRFNTMQRTRMCAVPVSIQSLTNHAFIGEDLSATKLQLCNPEGSNLFNAENMVGTIRAIGYGIRTDSIKSTGKTNLPSTCLDQTIQQYGSLGLLGRDYLDCSSVIDKSVLHYVDFDAIYGFVLSPNSVDFPKTASLIWTNPRAFSELLGKGLNSGFFSAGRSSNQSYSLQSLPPNQQLLILRFLRFHVESRLPPTPIWTVKIAKSIEDCSVAERPLNPRSPNVTSWADTILGELSTVVNQVRHFFDYESGSQRLANLHGHFNPVKSLCYKPRDMDIYAYFSSVTTSGPGTSQDREAVDQDRAPPSSRYYGAVPRHAVKQQTNPSTLCSPTAAISSLYTTFKQAFHELRNSGSMMNGFLTIDLLKLLFQSSAANEALPEETFGFDKIILTYHLWNQALIAGEMFRLDQVGMKQPSLSSFNAFAFAELTPVTNSGLPVTGKNIDAGQSAVTWLETNALGIWDICGDDDSIEPRWGSRGILEFAYGDLLDPQANNVLFIPGDWGIHPCYPKMLAILIILCTGWGRYYPVVTHSFTDEAGDELEAVFAVIAGWTHLDGVTDLKIVLPSTFPITGTKFANEQAARCNLKIIPIYGPDFGMNGANCAITWINNQSERIYNRVDLHVFVMSWINSIGLNDLTVFNTICKVWFDLNQDFHDFNIWSQSLSIYHMPAEVIQKADAGVGLSSTVDLAPSTPDRRGLPDLRIARKYPHTTAEGERENWFLPTNDQNRCVPNLYTTRRDHQETDFPFSITFTHSMETFNMARLSMLLLGIYNCPYQSPNGSYDFCAQLPFETYHLSMVRAICSASVFSSLGYPPNFIISADNVDEMRAGFWDKWYDSRTRGSLACALYTQVELFGKSLNSYRGSFPMWISKQNSYSSIILTGVVMENVASYEDLVGDLFAVELVSEDVPTPFYAPSRKGSRFTYSKLAINVVCNGAPDWFKLQKVVSEFKLEQPSLPGLGGLIQLINMEGNDYLRNGKPLVPNHLVKMTTWQCKAVFIRPDPYFFTLCSVLASSLAEDGNPATFQLKQIDAPNLAADTSFLRIGPNEIISEISRLNTVSWYYAGEQQLPMGYNLILPWAYTLKRAFMNNISPIVMCDGDSRRTIETLQGVRTLATNQVLINRLGSSLTQPILTNVLEYPEDDVDGYFGKIMPKNSKAPASPGSSAGVPLPSTSTVATTPFVRPAGGGVSESQDAGSGSTEM